MLYEASNPQWLPSLHNVDVVSLYLNCDLEGAGEGEGGESQKTFRLFTHSYEDYSTEKGRLALPPSWAVSS